MTEIHLKFESGTLVNVIDSSIQTTLDCLELLDESDIDDERKKQIERCQSLTMELYDEIMKLYK